MARNINLLPSEYYPNKTYVVIAKKIKTVTIVGFISLLIIIGTSAVAILMFSRQINNLSVEQNNLVKNLDRLKKSEAQIVLLKDRADKSKTIFDNDYTRETIMSFEKMNSNNSPNIVLTGLTIEGNKTELTISALNSKELETFIENLISSGLYKAIFLNDMALGKEGAYSASFILEI